MGRGTWGISHRGLPIIRWLFRCEGGLHWQRRDYPRGFFSPLLCWAGIGWTVPSSGGLFSGCSRQGVAHVPWGLGWG